MTLLSDLLLVQWFCHVQHRRAIVSVILFHLFGKLLARSDDRSSVSASVSHFISSITSNSSWSHNRMGSIVTSDLLTESTHRLKGLFVVWCGHLFLSSIRSPARTYLNADEETEEFRVEDLCSLLEGSARENRGQSDREDFLTSTMVWSHSGMTVYTDSQYSRCHPYRSPWFLE